MSNLMVNRIFPILQRKKKSHFFFHSEETWQNHLNQVTGIHNNDSGTNQPHVLLDRMQ